MSGMIIDTDLGADCDDAGAVALACLLHRGGEIELLGIGHNTMNRFGIEATDVICRQFGCLVPLGSCKTVAPNPCDGYAEKLVGKFGARRRFDDTPDAVRLYRRLLSENKDVKIVGIGQANNLSALVDSPADAFGPCGKELLAEHVSEVILMAGIFGEDAKRTDLYGPTGEAEYNVATDIPSMQNFLEKCAVPVTFADFILGARVMTLGEGNGSDPLSFAYKEFCGGAHESWDLTAVLYAARGTQDFVRHGGTVRVDDVGRTHFVPDGGKDGYLRPRFGYQSLQEKLNRFFGIGEKVCING